MTDEIYIEANGVQVSEDFLEHYGILRKSGRYPWGSGETPNQRHRMFINYIEDLERQGLTLSQIGKGLGDPSLSTEKLRALKTIAKNEIRAEEQAMALRLKEKGLSNTAIGERMGINESSVRGLLKPAETSKSDQIKSVADFVKKRVDEDGYIDIGLGNGERFGMSKERFNIAMATLEEDGYTIYNNVKVKQLGMKDQSTTVKIITKPGTSFKDVMDNTDKIKTIHGQLDDDGHPTKLKDPKSFPSSRLKVVYGEEGAKADGLMYIRPGIDDLSLGKSGYAQVRIAVDDTHYLKGMAIYKKDLPDGVDIQFHTPKKDTGNKLDALKPLKDPELYKGVDRFGSSISRQKGYLNIVNEEGSWENWSRTLASQMLSKQDHTFAQKQLDLYYQKQADRFDEIKSITNPVVKRKLLESFSDNVDSATVSLKAAKVPGMSSHVIIPIKSMKDTEVYAPNFKTGDKVVLIRYPHGGIFEIPELTVNNRNKEGSEIITNKARDAIGINSKVAEKMSGADFDGDSVMVIPNNNGQIKTKKVLAGLKDFDPKTAYPAYPGMKPITSAYKQNQMGVVSNLITDMTIKGASDSEITRAVRHSMVIIDAEKHKLNYRQSAKDNGIEQLRNKYQRDPETGKKGVSTIISRAKSSETVVKRIPRRASEGGPIDPKTGKKMYSQTGEEYTVAKLANGKKTSDGKREVFVTPGKDYVVDKKTGAKLKIDPTTIQTRVQIQKSTRMAETDDAFSLVSSNGGTQIERVYATHANKMKALANDARKELVNTQPIRVNKEAAAKYKAEIDSLTAKRNRAYQAKPLERQARILSNAIIKQKIQANPNMDDDTRKKIERQALNQARERLGVKKFYIDITPKEWEAIQSGAISNNRLQEIIDNADLDKVTKLAMPHKVGTLTPAKESRARAMANNGATRAEIAEALGVSTTTLSKLLGGDE